MSDEVCAGACNGAGEDTNNDAPDSTQHTEPTITPYPDGPLIVRGPITLRAADGTPMPQRRRTIALCRCGLSAIKPLCDGTHKLSGFRTDDE